VAEGKVWGSNLKSRIALADCEKARTSSEMFEMQVTSGVHARGRKHQTTTLRGAGYGAGKGWVGRKVTQEKIHNNRVGDEGVSIPRRIVSTRLKHHPGKRYPNICGKRSRDSKSIKVNNSLHR